MDENILLGMKEFDEAKKYWQEKLLHAGISSLPHDLYGSASSGKNKCIIAFDKGLTDKLLHICNHQDMSVYIILLAAFKVLISKFTGQEDIVVASPLYEAGDVAYEYSNVVLMRDLVSEDLTFKEFLMQVRQTVMEGYRNQHYPVDKIFGTSSEKRKESRGYYKNALVMESIHGEGDITEITGSPENEIIFCMVRTQQGLGGSAGYAPGLFTEKAVESIVDTYLRILEQVSDNINIAIREIGLVGMEEERKLLYSFNSPCDEAVESKTIHGMFAEQAKNTPEHIALQSEERSLTYKELDEKSGRLVGVLAKNGVATNRIVGIMAQRSTDLIVGMLGILKAGGAYLPIDPTYPQERIRYMLEDSKIDILLTQSHLKDRTDFSGTIIELDDENIYRNEYPGCINLNSGSDLAYVIYTSGSSGKPKGVMIEHGSILNYIEWRIKNYRLDTFDTTLQLLSAAFDGFGCNLYSSLLSGGRLILPSDTSVKDYSHIKELIRKESITNTSLVPSMYRAILESAAAGDLKSLRFVVLAAEKADRQLLEKSKGLAPKTILINEYGPTENSVATTAHIGMSEEKISIIGKPISANRIYIVNHSCNLMPIGFSGELCVSGKGLSRGYLNRLDLTLEKFPANPFEPLTRMYKTGDIARWLPDGNIELLGRMDSQVKIRGHRIEPEEIESVLLGYKSVKQAAVAAREGKNGALYLYAYIVSDEKMDEHGLRSYLSGLLPEYMIPSVFTRIERMPLSANGKIDRKLLPDPDTESKIEDRSILPANKTEQTIRDVWQAVLNIDPIGVRDNFFALGGDSIKTIQIAARLKGHGIIVNSRDIFMYPTIEELSLHVQLKVIEANQGIVEGEAELLPIQEWFFQKKFKKRHHFNQSVMLYKSDGIDAESVKKAFDAIIEHHDALRMVYRIEKENIRQFNRGMGGQVYSLDIMDLTECADLDAEICAKADHLQAGVDIENGPLVKLGLLKTGEGDHLLIVIHHLAVDGISWRIIMEDFIEAYGVSSSGGEVKLPDKTASFKEWADKVKEYSNSMGLLKELNYWQEVESTEVPVLPKDFAIREGRIRDNITIEASLTEADTVALLKRANRAYNTEINDLLLTALAMAISKYTGEEKILIDLEGHGRESLEMEIDINRTVGWFTSKFSVILEASHTRPIHHNIKVTKETLRRIPNKGMGYGILRYKTAPENRKNLSFKLNPEISFNYLGQFDWDSKAGPFGISPYSAGAAISPDEERLYSLDIVCLISGGKLNARFTFNSNEYRYETVLGILEDFKKSLESIIEHCLGIEEEEPTPSDLGCGELTINELEKIFDIISTI